MGAPCTEQQPDMAPYSPLAIRLTSSRWSRHLCREARALMLGMLQPLRTCHRRRSQRSNAARATTGLSVVQRWSASSVTEPQSDLGRSGMETSFCEAATQENRATESKERQTQGPCSSFASPTLRKTEGSPLNRKETKLSTTLRTTTVAFIWSIARLQTLTDFD